MRRSLSLAVAAAAAATVLVPAAPANAAACQYPLSIACNAICIVYDALDRPCPR
jgi:hypothetical protein